ncbi:MAG: hypothetical protein ACKO9A_06095, partial [Alphaproteobacteria bacterium]
STLQKSNGNTENLKEPSTLSGDASTTTLHGVSAKIGNAGHYGTCRRYLQCPVSPKGVMRPEG